MDAYRCQETELGDMGYEVVLGRDYKEKNETNIDGWIVGAERLK